MIDEMVKFLTASLGHTRVYPTTLPQEPTLPAVTYFIVDTVGDYAHDERVGEASRVQVDCYASSHRAAWTLGELARTTLEKFGRAYGGAALVDGPADMGEPPELGRWRVKLEAMMEGLKI